MHGGKGQIYGSVGDSLPSKSSHIGSRLVLPSLASAQEEEDQKEDGGEDQDGDKGRDDARERVRLLVRSRALLASLRLPGPERMHG